MKVLFSPIGTTDPISNNKDGGMLHICRVYRPQKIYLYLSKEMCHYHDLDNRYCRSISMLTEEIGEECLVEVIRDEDMENVQIFDAFIDLFENILNDIRAKDNPEQILVNVSSGTPAMKSSLQIISMLWNDVDAIQVSTPVKSSNYHHEDRKNYDLEIQWECNEDCKKDFENRCIVSDAKRLLDRIRKENIQKYIEAYDYEAAKMQVATLSKQPSEKFKECLNLAIKRINLDTDLEYIEKNKKRLNIGKWFPITNEREMKEYEYILAMQVKQQKKNYADFIKDITPIFFSLSKRALYKLCHLKFEDIGNRKHGTWYISMEKLKEKSINPQPNWNNYAFISSNIILEIIKQKATDQEIINLMEKIRLVEKEVRNLAAHEIVGVTEGWIRERTKYSSEKIMDMIFGLAELSGIHISNENRRIYDIMNESLIDLL